MEHILTLLIFFPAVAALLGLVVRDNFRIYGIVVSAIELSGALMLWSQFDATNSAMQFIHFYPLFGSFGIHYYVGVDGISLFLIILAAFISLIGFIFLGEHQRMKHLVISLLFLETIMIGVFCALDAMLFYVFWELSLVPMLYIIGSWGSGERIYAAVKFFLYTFTGSIIMLVGMLYMAYLHHEAVNGAYWSFSILEWQSLIIPFDVQKWLFLAFFAGLAVKVPMFPFHTWLPYAHGQAPTIGSVILAAVLLKMGTYGFLRFSLPMFPDASIAFITPIAILSLCMIIYGAMVAYAQEDMKQVIAYSSISHMGVIMLGIFAMNVEGISGSIFFMISHGIVSGALFMLVGVIYERKHTKMLNQMGGLARVMPHYAAIFGIMLMASVGLPLTIGFVGEYLSLLGFFAISPVMTLFAGTSIIFGAVYMLVLFKKVFFGKITHNENLTLKDLNMREWSALLPLVFVVIWLGVYPKPLLSPIDTSVSLLIDKMQLKATTQEARDILNKKQIQILRGE
ncbi:NADH-quinone oxidoreductase subunit M [Helicobacter monodelphidis]|uniref:NADH-quinone oxidoreductase subunit M n=1 Tax=Helicobacter sp. 15-1451 TaxID=2004995 RepID=UPI000DCE631D|nr:NADH-quinone oxidoreductase subunit M [Helicobacter sp. 15-1451]RAX59283.1 NADH-quinone oxidoreductase subunit M [Helicobacter sp. 15-1451]